jgi:hypothetical protein
MSWRSFMQCLILVAFWGAVFLAFWLGGAF